MKQSGEHVKPEAAAQEPERNHDPYDLCEVCSPEMSATAAPSQPAGARESDEYVGATLFRQQRDWLIAECARVGVTVNVIIGAPLEQAYQLVNDAAQQTAAKDAAYERLAEATVADLKALKTEKEAIERERDSLRVENAEMAELKLNLQCEETRVFSIITELEGTVEGQPTSRLNYLQRIRELRAAERERDSLRAALKLILHTPPLGEARLTVRKLQDIANAALKAGKE